MQEVFFRLKDKEDSWVHGAINFPGHQRMLMPARKGFQRHRSKHPCWLRCEKLALGW